MPNYRDPPKRFTRELQVDGEIEEEEPEWHFDRYGDSSWDNLCCWQGTLAEIGPSDRTLGRFEDDGGQPAPETERRQIEIDNCWPYFLMVNAPAAVRR